MLSSLRNIRFASSKPTIFIAPLFRCQMFVAVNAMAMTVADVVAVCKSTSLVLGWLSSHTSYTYMLHHTLDDATSAHERYSFPTFMSKDHFHSIFIQQYIIRKSLSYLGVVWRKFTNDQNKSEYR